MRKNVKLRLASISIASGILISSATSYGQQVTLEKNHWGIKSMERLVGEGVFKGYEDGSLRPNQAMTKAEFISMVNNMYGFKEEETSQLGPTQAWYTSDLNRAQAKDYLGILANNGFKANDKITREEAAGVLAKLLNLQAKEPALLTDRQTIAPDLRPSVDALAASSFISGYQDGSFKPKAALTRAEMASLTSKAVSKIYNKPGTYEGAVDGHVIINSSGVQLKNAKINGNIYIGGDLGPNQVALKNTNISGDLIVHGPDPACVNLENTNIDQLTLVKNSQVSQLEVQLLARQNEKDSLKENSKASGTRTSRKTASSSSGGSSSRDKDPANKDEGSSKEEKPHKETSFINRQASKIVNIEGVFYGLLVLDQGSINDYKIYLDGNLVQMEKVNTSGSILKYELANKARVHVSLENSTGRDSFILDIK